MLNRWIAEATECDFKISLERKKPRSWLKSVSAFANGIGGTLFFGIDDNRNVVGLADAQSDAEAISRLIKERITPIPNFTLKPDCIDGKNILALIIDSGRSTPYYYRADGVREAYIRIGSESVIAPDYVVNELILRGQNRTFDSLTSTEKKSDYSFTLLAATYRERTGLAFQDSDFLSFGLVDQNGYLTNAGALLADQHIVYNSRIFCTRWNGLDKGSIFDDAIDDKEYEGNLIYLLQSGCAFVRNNSKVRFEKKARFRIDKPDYSDRAVTEALVNALIHRDYVILGSEIHIDMYDDRLVIYSPGGMYDGKTIQNCDLTEIGSARRNPVIADVFHRMKYMERRGSGIRKIMESTSKLPGYDESKKPSFYSTPSAFFVTLKNMNYHAEVADSASWKTNDTLRETIQEWDPPYADIPASDMPDSALWNRNLYSGKQQSTQLDEGPHFMMPELTPSDINQHFDVSESALSGKNQHFGESESALSGRNQHFGESESALSDDNQRFTMLLSDMKLNKPRKDNVRKLHGLYGTAACFGRAEIMEVTGLSASPASDLIRKLLAAGMIVRDRKQGRGKYRFNL